ncbi:MAG: ribosome maturation factor RimM [Gammaproteobacteria bacterium]
MPRRQDETICVGHITGAQGIQGWVRVFSNTSPRENIVSYSPWLVETGERLQAVEIKGRLQGRNVVAKLDGVEDRDQANEMIGSKIYILPEQLPKLEEGEFYWSQLIGLEVESLQADALGTIEAMMETGANDVMVLKGDRERLIPFVMDEVVREVDLINKRIVVDWQPDY